MYRLRRQTSHKHGAGLDGSLLKTRQSIMKAVLEFNYPQDEDNLRYALNGHIAILGLREIKKMLENKAYKAALNHVNLCLNDCGEETNEHTT